MTHTPARLPLWLRRPVPSGGHKADVERLVEQQNLHTVCLEAKCPNRVECFGRGTATFLVMGEVCTRSCRFCGVNKNSPAPLDPDEPRRIAESVASLRLHHAVITSVTRDDLPDGGAGHFAAIIQAIGASSPQTTIEVLVPDFQGDMKSAARVLDCRPDVYNHNVETVPRLYPAVRPQADYARSLGVLAFASAHQSGAVTKSGLMVGLGETEKEVVQVLTDLREAGCRIVTIGQYLQPSSEQLPVQEYVPPPQFERYRLIGHEMGLAQVFAGPFVRSSYHAEEVLREVSQPSH